jgi:hypothetical protein
MWLGIDNGGGNVGGARTLQARVLLGGTLSMTESFRVTESFSFLFHFHCAKVLRLSCWERRLKSRASSCTVAPYTAI